MGKRLRQIIAQIIHLLLTVFFIAAANFLSCHNLELRSAPVSQDYHTMIAAKPSLSSTLERRGPFVVNPQFHFDPTSKDLAADQGPVQLEPILTPWSEPWRYDKLCHTMDQILKEADIQSPTVRVRMIAHAIVSSGWRQHVWHYNAWGVKRGSWGGPWYKMTTVEEDKIGREMVVSNEEWRAFSSWREAVEDYKQRITKDSNRPSYRRAARYLHSKDYRDDVTFWESLGEGNYYTTRKFSPREFSSLCFRVREELRIPPPAS